ncbi:MAG: hypothetical protein JSU57_05750 [Candidatus Heimdallarchaeota archaeon]|nr:MAG: hypothetical protein JSU57_05750 [Candidatus Heimdallarchaeota archaeon]
MVSIDSLMVPINLFTSLLLTFSPIIILFLPYLYTRRKDENILAIIFNRAFIGFIVFYLAYFIFPSILNSFVPNPTQYMDQEYYPVSGTEGWEGTYSTTWDSAAVDEETINSILTSIGLPGLPLLVKYMFQHFVNSIVNYLYYPIIILAFVFGISPIISMAILLYQTWGERQNERKPLRRLLRQNVEEIKILQNKQKFASEDEISEITREINTLEKDIINLKQQLTEIRSVTQRLQEIQFEMEVSPFQEITKRVKEKEWGNERELLKVLIAILPITLFLLMTILRLLGETENPSLLQGTAMGHFLEIFFAYVASIVFSVYLIKASRLSRKGKFLGNQLYVAMVQSLSTVGLFTSGLAVILFLFEYTDQIFVVSYFVVYFIMVSVFFVLFLDIFEPFSIYLFIKFIETFKNLKMAFKRVNIANIAKSGAMGVIIGLLLAVGFLVYYNILKGLYPRHIDTVQYETFFWFTLNYASFFLCAAFILFIRRWNWSVFVTTLVTYLSIVSVSFLIFLWYDAVLYYDGVYYNGLYQFLGLRNAIFVLGGFPLIPPFNTLTAGLAGGEERLKWYTTSWKEGAFNDVLFIIPELRQISVIWKGQGGTFLGLLSIPYNLLHPFAIIMTYGAILFLVKRKFHVRTEKSGKEGEEKIQHKSIFSDMGRLPSLGELTSKSDMILVGATYIDDPELKQRMDEAWLSIENGQQLREAITGKIEHFDELPTKSGLTPAEIHRILDELTFDIEVPFNQILTILHREFSYSFEEVTIDSLHIMMLDGRAVLSHTFAAESLVEPALVAGLFSAITSFAKEAVRSEQLLKTIDHGDVVLTIEYAKWVFAAIFADSTSSELRKKLNEFLTNFEEKYAKTLPTWLGDLEIFKGDIETIDDVFSPG